MTAAARVLADRRLTFIRIGTLAALGLLVSLAWWIFDRAGYNYWQFWLNSGPVIGLATAAFGWAWGNIDRRPDLVSADPVRYLAGVFGMCALPFLAFSSHFTISRQRNQLISEARDVILTVSLFLVFSFAVLSWLIIIAPAQYFAFLVFGAPSRLALRSQHRVYAREVDREIAMVSVPVSQAHQYPEDDGWWDASMRDRPVTISSGFMAASLLIFDFLVS